MNGTKPIVSVVIIAHNEKHNIARALKSLAQQSFSQFEIVVVDDASTDNTALIVEHLALHDSRIILHRLPHNHGMQHARIIGAGIASCPLVTFLDADDTFAPNALSELYNRHCATDADIVEMASCHSVVGCPVKIDLHIPSHHLDKTIYPRQLMIDLLLKGEISANVWSKLYRKNLIENALMQPSGHTLGEDLIFNLRVMSHANSFAWTDYRGARYNSGKSNFSRFYHWDEQKKLCDFLLNNPEIKNNNARKSIVAINMVEDLTENVALRLFNPFSSLEKTRLWISHELSLDFWTMLRPILDERSRCIVNSCDETITAAKQKLRRNRKNYTIFHLLNFLSRK